MSWFDKEFFFNSPSVSFQTLVTYSVIDLAEYQIVARSKKLEENHKLRKDYAFAISEELEHARMHTEMWNFYKGSFFEFAFLRRLYRKILTSIPKGVFWSTIAWFEMFNAHFWIDFERTFDLDKYESFSPYKKNMLWHYAEEAAHGHAFWESYEAIASQKKKNRDGYYYVRNLSFICTVILISMILIRPWHGVKYIPGYFSYLFYSAKTAIKIAKASPEERARVLAEAHEKAAPIIGTVVKRSPFELRAEAQG